MANIRLCWIKSGLRNKQAVDEKRGIKKGKYLISHRYNRLPLLGFPPGGLNRSWSYEARPAQI
jgi:hypothetical protein